MTTPPAEERTEVGNYFVSNYPPFSCWSSEELPAVEAALDRPAEPGVPLGLYLHVPFCRKRCKFCYFRVYTDKSSRDVERYLAALAREVSLVSRRAAVAGRPFRFVYFGGGTPSFLSAQQLRSLVARLRESIAWDDAEEITFECEPGTLRRSKLEAIAEIGVTRLSLGVENFDDRVLEENGRAHRSAEILRSYREAREIGFRQINIDLISGMVGESGENWSANLERTVELEPDSVTIYQLELPYNTLYSRQLAERGLAVADWRTKREWVAAAFDRLGAAGYRVSSAYTLVRDPRTTFVYRDSLWHGADMLGTGVASFGHLDGVHYQNVDGFEEYCARLEEGRLPLGRGLPLEPEQRCRREFILQLKLGRVAAGPFREKFGVDVLSEHDATLSRWEREGMLEVAGDEVRLTREGLLRVDGLLPSFFEPRHRGIRTT